MKKIILTPIILIILVTLTFANRITPVVLAIKKVEHAVVNIRTEQIVRRNINPFFSDPFFGDFFGFNKVYKTQSVGSGFIIGKDGIVATNNHVIESATTISVILDNGKQYDAEIIGKDKKLDIALIKIKTDKKFTPVKLGNSDDILLGETVIGLGNPYGLNNSVTTGVISNKIRLLPSGDHVALYIQTDTLINPGNSGGPLVNLDGEVIGINSAIYKEAQGIGFSIPINILKRIVPELKKYGHIRKGYYGFSIKENNNGIYVNEIDKTSKSYKKGIRKNYKILSVAGIPTGDLLTFESLIYSYPPGSSVNISFSKGEKIKTINIKIEEIPENFGLIFLKDKYGLEFKEKNGFIVITKSNIPYYFKKGDTLIAVENKEINKFTDFKKILNQHIGQNITFTVYRNKKVFNISIRL
jgi:serine protease Do